MALAKIIYCNNFDKVDCNGFMLPNERVYCVEHYILYYNNLKGCIVVHLYYVMQHFEYGML